jgi:hypothetical protein
MALSDYQELRKSVIDWGDRGSSLDLLIDDFILLAEKEMFKNNRAHEALEIREGETSSTQAVTTRTFPLPTGYSSMRSMRLVLDNGNGTLRFKSPEGLVRRSGTGQPAYFTVTSQIELDVTPDQSYTVEHTYYQKPTGLSLTNTTNIVLTNHPDIYLHGTLWAFFIRAKDKAMADYHYQLFSEAIDGANEEDNAGRFGPAPAARIEGPTP